jgi:hypothetical protein
MAEILDDVQPNLELQEGESAAALDEDNLLIPEDPEVEQTDAESTEDVPEASNQIVDPDPLPEKFANKSVHDVAKMYQQLESKMGEQGDLIGKQTQELNHLRHTLDAFALRNQGQSQEPEEKPIEEADFFSDPQTTVNRAIEQHPALQQAQDMAKKMAYAQSLTTLQQRHPDLKEIVSSDDFKKWITSSPNRVQRYQKADQYGDVNEADDLITTYKEVKQVEKQAKAVGQKAQKQAVKNASTGAVRGNSDARSSKKIYWVHDLAELYKTDQARYEAMGDEILRAYAEGRVRRA